MPAMFSPSLFTPTQRSSRECKARFAEDLARFIRAGCPKSLFSYALYNRLSVTFGHNTHGDRTIFYDCWFLSPSKRLRWLKKLSDRVPIGDPSYTWSDVEKVVRAWVTLQSVVWERYAKDAEKEPNRDK